MVLEKLKYCRKSRWLLYSIYHCLLVSIFIASILYYEALMMGVPNCALPIPITGKIGVIQQRTVVKLCEPFGEPTIDY